MAYITGENTPTHITHCQTYLWDKKKNVQNHSLKTKVAQTQLAAGYLTCQDKRDSAKHSRWASRDLPDASKAAKAKDHLEGL